MRRARGLLHVLTALGVLTAGALGMGGRADARPSYFTIFTDRYAIDPGDNLHACGVCHVRWEGTGARNLYGNAVEQGLYVGKPIEQAIEDIEGDDTDGDGFTNVDEIVTWMTLPGYSCDNFFEAINPPSGYDTYIEPMVASCLDPHDIRLSRASISVIAAVGTPIVVALQVFNNGSTNPLMIDDYSLLAGTHPFFSVSGPSVPLSIPVGQSIVLQVTFDATAQTIASGTLRIESDDPDEMIIDVPLSGIAVQIPLAEPEDRAACLKDIDKHFQRYTKKVLREWNRCYLDEVSGVACDTGRRDLKLEQAETKLRARIGGARDRRCAGNDLTPTFAGLPNTCGSACAAIAVTTFGDYVDCLVCRADEARDGVLTAALGTAPPDLPPNLVAGLARRCQKKLLVAERKGVSKLQKRIGRCELDNITAAAPVDCQAVLAAKITADQVKVNKSIDRCVDTTGMLGCLFEPAADPACLGDAALAIANELVTTTYGLE